MSIDPAPNAARRMAAADGKPRRLGCLTVHYGGGREIVSAQGWLVAYFACPTDAEEVFSMLPRQSPVRHRKCRNPEPGHGS